jgi:hypothetical protein
MSSQIEKKTSSQRLKQQNHDSRVAKMFFSE